MELEGPKQTGDGNPEGFLNRGRPKSQQTLGLWLGPWLENASQWLTNLNRNAWRPIAVGLLALNMNACKPIVDTTGFENQNPPPPSITEPYTPLPPETQILLQTLQPTPTGDPNLTAPAAPTGMVQVPDGHPGVGNPHGNSEVPPENYLDEFRSTETPTQTLTQYSEPTPSPQPTKPPTPTPSETPTPTPPLFFGELTLKNPNEAVNIRTGPGTNYKILETLDSTETFLVKGKTPDGKWMFGDLRNKDGSITRTNVWVTGVESWVNISGGKNNIPVVSPELIHSTPTRKPTPEPTVTPIEEKMPILEIKGRSVEPEWDSEFDTWVWKDENGQVARMWEKTTRQIMVPSQAGRLLVMVDADFKWAIDISGASSEAVEEILGYWAQKRSEYYGSNDLAELGKYKRIVLVFLPSTEFNKDPLNPQWSEGQYIRLISPGYPTGYTIRPFPRVNNKDEKEFVFIMYFSWRLNEVVARKDVAGDNLLAGILFDGFTKAGGSVPDVNFQKELVTTLLEQFSRLNTSIELYP